MNPSQATYELWVECDLLLDGEPTQEEIDAVFLEAEGYRHFMRLMRCDGILSDKTVTGLRKLKGWLGAHMENMGNSVPSTTVNASAQAQSSASVTFSQAVQAIERFDNSELSEGEKDELLGMLSRLEAADVGKDPSAKDKAAKIIKWLGDKSADVMTAVAPIVMKSLLGQ